MTNVVNHLQLPVVADIHVVALGSRQLMPIDGIGRVRVAGRVAGGAGQVFQLVEPLPLNLQPDWLDELGERPVDVIVRTPAGDVPLDHLRVAVDPRVPLASAKQKLIVRPLAQDNAKRLGRLRPQRQEVLGARLAAPVLQPLSGEVGLRFGQFGQLLRPEPAVERQQDHRLHLLPRRSAPRDASRDQLIDAGQDAPDVGGLVQRPIHRRCPAACELADGLLPKIDRRAPMMIGGISAGVPKVSDRPLCGVDPVGRGNPAIDVRGVVGGQLVDRPLAGHRVDPLPAAAVLAVGVESNLPPFGVGLSDQQPAIEDVPQVDDRAGRHGLRLRRRRCLREHGSALAVVLPQRGLGRDLPSDPAGAASNASLVAARVDGQRRVRRQLRGPVHASPLAREKWRAQMARPFIRDSGSENKAPPARGRRRTAAPLGSDLKPLHIKAYSLSAGGVFAAEPIFDFNRKNAKTKCGRMAQYGAAIRRSRPPKRRTPLPRSTKPLIRSPIRRVSPRARARSRAWAAVCRAVFASCGGRCQVGGPGCTGRAVTCHHVRMRSQARDDTPANALAVCARCHRHLHDHPADAAARGFILQRKDGAAC